MSECKYCHTQFVIDENEQIRVNYDKDPDANESWYDEVEPDENISPFCIEVSWNPPFHWGWDDTYGETLFSKYYGEVCPKCISKFKKHLSKFLEELDKTNLDIKKIVLES